MSNTELLEPELERPRAQPTFVVLSDGTRFDLSRLSVDALHRLQWNQERDFARRIVAAPKGSHERAEAARIGYDTVCTILAALRENATESLAMGHDSRYERLVLGVLENQRRHGLTPRLFEVGYGTGRLLEAVSRRGYDIGGIEISGAMHQEACRGLPRNLHADLLRGDFMAENLASRMGNCSLVYWNDVFEHIPPDEILDYLRKIHALLVPGGSLITITPNWHTRPSDVTSGFHPPRTTAVGFHLREYTLRDVTSLLRQAGFTNVATPLVALRSGMILAGNGGAAIKRAFEPALEYLPFPLAKLLCRGFGLYATIARKD